MKKKWLSTLLLTTSSFLVTSISYANWSVHSPDSSLHFLSVKANAPGASGTTEVHHVKHIDGTLKKNGDIALVIGVNSIDTGIEIRDERMQTMLFNVEQYPKIEFKGSIDLTKADSLQVGQFINLPFNGQLQMAGKSKEIEATVRYQVLDADRIRVSSLAPLVINTDDFTLTQGVDALRDIAGLHSIATTVPINFDFVLVKNNVD